MKKMMRSPFTGSYIHDADHEQILLHRFEGLVQMEEALAVGDEAALDAFFSKARDSIRQVNRRYTPEEENPYQTLARLISINTLFTMACYRAGVHPLYVHSLSRQFDKTIPGCLPQQELDLVREMAGAYCKLIREAKMEHYGEFSDQVIRLLLSSLADPPSLTELSRQMFVSTATMTRRFKKETGQTIPEFLNRSRVRVAKLYMQSRDVNLGQIAQRVGFSDASYFSKVFRRYEGMSPTQYLKKLSSNR